ncbi:hypothetical protein LCGC14_2036260, partial [marine sediment metagenome]
MSTWSPMISSGVGSRKGNTIYLPFAGGAGRQRFFRASTCFLRASLPLGMGRLRLLG